ncbi:unnamed protein product [Camellia sinensis]
MVLVVNMTVYVSAYAHQMEREYSNRSLSSRGGSEIGSHYVVEAGFYMTSFAATLFLAALVTCGVLLVTLLIALTVMLQSCESRNAGIVEISKANENYNYCKIFSLHAELNSLDVDQFPEICRITAVQYIKEGQYAKDLNLTMGVAENYFNGVRPLEDGLDMVLMDIDDFLPLTSHCTDPLQSRKPEKQRNATIEYLISAGYGGWSSLVMRLEDEMQMDSREYFSRLRNSLQKQSCRITAVISSQMDALTGPYSGNRIGYIAPQKDCASKPATAGFRRELIFRRVWLLARLREGLNQSSGTRLTLMGYPKLAYAHQTKSSESEQAFRKQGLRPAVRGPKVCVRLGDSNLRFEREQTSKLQSSPTRPTTLWLTICQVASITDMRIWISIHPILSISPH